jgi:hypothetical protein
MMLASQKAVEEFFLDSGYVWMDITVAAYTTVWLAYSVVTEHFV